jgi:hypothetical protein
MDGDLERSAVPAPVLRDKRAYWLYQVPIVALAALPLLVVLGLVLLSWAGVQLASEVITIMGTLAAAALGGLVNLVTARGSNG